MKKLYENIRRQNTPDLSLDEQILERAKTMRAGKKEMLSVKGKEHIEMKVSMNREHSSETAIVRKNHGALIAAAAAVVMVVGGVAAAVLNDKMPVEPINKTASSNVSEQPAESSSQTEATDSENAVSPVSDSSSADRPETSSPEEEPTVTTIVPDEKPSETEVPQTDLVKDWAKPYLEKNPDTVGYIHIPGFDNDEYFKIDFPVVQKSGSEWTYYLSHDFYGDDYRRGTLVAPDDGGTNTITADGQPRNTIIYGYNAFDEFPETDELYDEKERGLMFTGLKQYQQGIDFYREHALIDYKTIYEDSGEYVIFAVFTHDADEDNIFTAEAFGNAQHSFDEWISRVKSESNFECDIECTADDKYLTLITPVHPDDDPNNYRIVIAKKLTPKDDKQAIINSVRMNMGDTGEDASDNETKGTDVRIEIPLPNGLKGSYTFDLYRDGIVIATKTIEKGEEYAGTFISMDIVVYESETLAIYVRSNDFGKENYIHFGEYYLDLSTGEVIGDVRTNPTDILKITPQN